MATALREEVSESTILHGLSYGDYTHIVAEPANYHLKMAYLDGVLEIVSPKITKHEIPSVLLMFLVSTVADELGLKSKSVGSGTYHRRGVGTSRGAGAEPDQSFYIANYHRFPRDRDLDLDAGDPPPDLWIEVDHRVSSARRLPIYARLGVPEIWCYRPESKSVEFLQLIEDSYHSVEWSVALPILSPSRVREALELSEGLSDQEWVRLLRDWTRRIVADRANDRLAIDPPRSRK